MLFRSTAELFQHLCQTLKQVQGDEIQYLTFA